MASLRSVSLSPSYSSFVPGPPSISSTLIVQVGAGHQCSPVVEAAEYGIPVVSDQLSCYTVLTLYWRAMASRPVPGRRLQTS